VIQMSRRCALAIVAVLWAGATGFDALFILSEAGQGNPIPFSWRLRNVLVAQLGPLSDRWSGGPGTVLLGALLWGGIILLVVWLRSWIAAWIAFLAIVFLWHFFGLAVWFTSIT
jgi:hypothetical protein